MHVPQLRFKGFDEDWKEYPFGRIASITMGQSPSGDSYNTLKNGAPLINGPTEFGVLYPTPVQWTTKPSKFSKPGDVLLCVRGSSIGRMNLSDTEYCIGRGVAAINGLANKTNSTYMKYLLEKEVNKILKKSTGSTFPNISGHELKKSLVSIPSILEQEKIADFLSLLDRKIQSQQVKIEKLEQFKKGMMQKIFSQELRFKDEDGGEFPEWEEKKLNELLYEKKIKNRNSEFEKGDVLSVSGEFGIVNQIDLLGRSFAGASVKEYQVVDIGDIVYTKSPLKKNPFGIIKVNKGKAGIVSTLYAVYSCKIGFSGNYLDYYFQLEDNTNKYLKPLVNKGAKNDMKVNNYQVLSGKIKIPSFSEQEKIAKYFSLLEAKLLKEKNKFRLLEEQKRWFLKEMFV